MNINTIGDIVKDMQNTKRIMDKLENKEMMEEDHDCSNERDDGCSDPIHKDNGAV